MKWWAVRLHRMIRIFIWSLSNELIGVIYRAHTAIDNFVHDISKEKKECYIMGDYNIDLLKDDSDRPTHDYLDLIYSHCLIPSILFPTRITEKSATIIDNILTNSDNEITTRILVTDITDHFPTILMTKSKTKTLPKTQLMRNVLHIKGRTLKTIFLTWSKNFHRKTGMIYCMVLMQSVIITCLLKGLINYMMNVYR